MRLRRRWRLARSPRALGLLLAMVCAVGTVAVTGEPAQAAPVSNPLAIGTLAPGGRVLGVDTTTVDSRVFTVPWTNVAGAATNRQRWTFELLLYLPQGSRNLYRVRNVAAPSLCLGVDSAESLRLQTCNTLDSQKWVVPHVVPTAGGHKMQIRSGTGFRCLNATADGDNLPGVMGCFSPDRPSQMWRTRTGASYCSSFDVTALCTSYNPSQQGLFGTWRQNPASFPNGRSAQVSQYLAGRTVDNQMFDNLNDWFEIGWRNSYSVGNSTTPPTLTREAYWLETKPGLLQYHSLAQLFGGADADGQNHTYMALSGANGKVDLLYDYNPAGTTTTSESAKISYLETGLSHDDAGTATIPAGIQHRVQTLDPNGLWWRPAAAGLYEDRPCYGPSWGLPFEPPACLTGATVARSTGELDHLSITQPTAAAPAAAGTRAAAPATGVLNGVDQGRLAACMQQDAHDCLATVPGLRECVTARQQCNAGAKQPATAARRGPAMTAKTAVAAARQVIRTERNRPLAASDRITTRTVPAASFPGADLVRAGADGADEVIVASSTAPVRGLPGLRGGESYRGFTLVYHAATATMVYACLGSSCKPATNTGVFQK